MAVGIHDQDLAVFATEPHDIVGPAQFAEVEGGGQALGVVVLDVDGHVTVPFGSGLPTGDLVV